MVVYLHAFSVWMIFAGSATPEVEKSAEELRTVTVELIPEENLVSFTASQL